MDGGWWRPVEASDSGHRRSSPFNHIVFTGEQDTLHVLRPVQLYLYINDPRSGVPDTVPWSGRYSLGILPAS